MSNARTAVAAMSCSSGTTDGTGAAGSNASSSTVRAGSSDRGSRMTRFDAEANTTASTCRWIRASMRGSSNSPAAMSTIIRTWSCAAASACAPTMILPAYGVDAISSDTNPRTARRSVRMARAIGFGAYPSRSTASSTRRRVRALTVPLPLSACDTVVIDTPASAATSRMLVARATWSPALCPSGPTALPGTTRGPHVLSLVTHSADAGAARD